MNPYLQDGWKAKPLFDIHGTIPDTTVKKPQPKKGRGGMLTSLISEAGGAGGAATGAAIGATAGSIVPFAGTALGGIIGGGIGGLLGGFGGRVAENEVRDSRLGIGDAAKEGAVSGVFGAGPLRLLKVGAGATKGIAGGVGLADALVNAGEKTATGGLGGKIVSIGAGLRSNVVNPKTTASVFGAGEDKAITETVNKYVKGLTGSAKYNNLETAVKGISGDIEKQLSKVPGKTNVAAFTTDITKNLADDLRYVPGDPAYEKELSRVFTSLGNKSKGGELTPSDLFKFKQYLGKQLTGAFNKDLADLTVPQQVRIAVWDNLDDHITKLAPGVKDLTRAQSLLIKSAKGLQQSANKTVGIPLAGLKSKSLNSVVQGAEDLGGKVLQSAPSALNNPFTREVLPGLFRAGSGAIDPAQQPQTLEDALMQGGGQPEYQPVDSNFMPIQNQAGADGMQNVEQGGSPYSQQNLMSDIQRDPKNAQEYIKYYASLQDVFAQPEAAKEKPLSATQQQQSNNAISALNDLQTIRDELKRDPSVAAKANLPGGSFSQRLTNSGNFEASRKNIGDVLARLRSGAAITDSEYKRYVALLPSAFDSKDVANNKMARLEQLLTAFANPRGTDSASLEDALMQYQN